jgi:hypothetical protein
LTGSVLDSMLDYVRRHVVSDLLYVGLTILFFALSYGFIVLCERMMEDKS